jgi:hypothetical protein
MTDSRITELPAASAIDDTDLLALAQDVATTPISKSSTILQLRGAIIGSSLSVGNLNLTGNTLSSTDTDGDINIVPNGNGRTKIGPSGVTNTMRGIITNGPASDLSWNGAGMHHFTAGDLAYPTKQFLNTAHNSVGEIYDAYESGINWISSHSGSNFMIYKVSDTFRMGKNSGTTAGSTFSWDYFWQAGTNGAINMPFQPHFNVYRNGNLTNVVGGSTPYTVPYNAVRDSANITFNTGTGKATVLVAGKYTFVGAVALSTIGNTNTDGYFSIWTSNKEYRGIRLNPWGTKSVGLLLGMTIQATDVDMDVGDVVEIRAWANGNATINVDGVTQVTWFTGIMNA